MYKKFLLLLLCNIAVTNAIAKIELPNIISDNMVLQQQAKVKLWGKSTPNSEISISTSWSPRIRVESNNSGDWSAFIPTPAGSYDTHEITIADNESQATLHNILIGEVWLASGQSNMEMTFGGFVNNPVKNSNEIIAEANSMQKKIRLLNIPRIQSYIPLDNVTTNWQIPNPQTVKEFSAVAYFYASYLNKYLNVPIGIINSSWGGSPIESWMDQNTLSKYPDIQLSRKDIENKLITARPMVMFNAMIYPLRNYTLKGFIWYQGEANIYQYKTYAQRMYDMVSLWRGLWNNSNMPFYFVEIAPHQYGIELSQYLREAQYNAQQLIPNCGMISTNDLVYDYEEFNIHPSQKEAVGKRLAFMAMNETYGIKSICSRGPEFQNVKFEKSQAIVTFKNAELGFNRTSDITGFEICGQDGNFYPAEAIVQNNTIIVKNKNVTEPTAVRYCFHDFMIGNLANTFGFPVVPFRTDK